VNNAVLFNHKQTIVADVIQMNGPVESQLGKGILDANTFQFFFSCDRFIGLSRDRIGGGTG
jgi:hypothetical protein